MTATGPGWDDQFRSFDAPLLQPTRGDEVLLPPRATASGTQRKIQEAALVMFAERGYHAVSVRELTQSAGLQVSGLYSHVKSKEQLLLDLVVLGNEEHRDRLRESVADAGSDALDQVRALVATHVRTNGTYRLLSLVANNELRALSSRSLERVLAIRHESERLLAEVAARGVSQGIIATSEPMLALAVVLGAGVRVAVWYRPGGPLTLDDIAGQYANFAVKLLT